jgi:DNA polymerase delta subunit 1
LPFFTNAVAMSHELFLHDITLHNAPSRGGSFPDKTSIDLWCFSADGSSALVTVTDFRVWMYVDVADGDAAGFLQRNRAESWLRNARCSVVKRKHFVGFTDNDLFDTILMEFGGIVPLYVTRKVLRAMEGVVTIYESSVDPVLKFLHASRLLPSSWFTLSQAREVHGDGKRSTCQREYQAIMGGLAPLEDVTRPPPPLVMCSWDIESTGLSPDTDVAFQISMVFARLGEAVDLTASHATSASNMDGVVLCVGETDSVDGTRVQCYDSEAMQRNVAILLGYNTHQFDENFVYKAAQRSSVQEFYKLSRLKGHVCELHEHVLESAAFGRNELRQLKIPGVVSIDLFMAIKRSYKFKSYKLKAVSEKIACWGGAAACARVDFLLFIALLLTRRCRWSFSARA